MGRRAADGSIARTKSCGESYGSTEQSYGDWGGVLDGVKQAKVLKNNSRCNVTAGDTKSLRTFLSGNTIFKCYIRQYITCYHGNAY